MSAGGAGIRWLSSDVRVGQYPVNPPVPALSSPGLLPSTRSVMG